jgi:G3E family GTPase
MKTRKNIPISVFTGFLGSGKTTLINKLIKTNPDIKFGLIINEFGEVGIDGKILDAPQEEIVEMSDGCMCCIVRSDLIEAVEKILSTGKIDYLIIETSGLAEPLPILQTFMSLNTDLCSMDALVTVVDAVNFDQFSKDYATVADQVKYGDVVVLNKVDDLSEADIEALKSKVQTLTDQATIVVNDKDFPTKLLIETNSWNVDKLIKLGVDKDELEESHNESHDHSGNHEHSHSDHSSHDHKHEDKHDHSHHDHSGHNHHHEHESVDEVVFKTPNALDPHKMDNWLKNNFPPEVIRAKGILNLQTPTGTKTFLFQMVGANKSLTTLEDFTKKSVKGSNLVLIGKGLNKKSILEGLESVVG